MSDESIDVKFGASTDELNDGVDSVKDKIASVGETASDLGEEFKQLKETLVAAFAVDQIAEFVVGTAEAAKQLELISNLSGFSQTSIQALQYAIREAGGDADGAATALTRFERNLYDAASGAGPAYEAFKNVGVSLDDLKHKSTEDLFRETLDGLSKVTDASQRNADALAIGGRSFAAFAASLHGGSASLDEAHAKMVELGAEDTPEMTSAFSTLDTKIKDAGESFEGLGRHILAEAVPGLETALGWVTKLTSAFSEIISIHDQFYTAMTRDAEVSENNADMAEKWTEALDSASGASASMAVATPNRTGPPKEKTQDDDAEGKDRSLYERQYESKKEYDDLMVQSGQMSHEQELADLQAALSQEQAAVDQSFAQQMSLYADDSKQYKNLQAEKAIADQQFYTQHLKLVQETTTKEEQQWSSAFETITKSMDTMLTGILQGTQTLQQAFQRFTQNLVVSFIEAVAKIIVENALLVLAQDQGWTQMSAALTKSLKDWVLSENQKTGATVAGNAQRTASNTAAATAGESSGAMAASKSIAQDASESAANVYSSVSAIPYVGWILAPAAAAAAFGAVMAFDSFDKGTNYVPNDMLANIHQGEMIIPKRQADSLREGGNLAGFGSGSGVQLHVHALDAASVSSMFARHGDKISSALVAAARGGNGALKSAMSRM